MSDKLNKICWLIIILISFCGIVSFSFINTQDSTLDYKTYYLKINQAEKQIFLKNDSIGGLLTIDSLFEKYDFVFVNDCIEFFQLAILYKRDDLAMHFIKKAMDNGFRIDLLQGLYHLSLTKNFALKQVIIFNPFIKKHKKELQQYEAKAFPKYVKHINKEILYNIIQRHIKEQIYKNFIPALGMTKEVQEKTFRTINNSNLDYIESLYKKNIFVGEKNIGKIDMKLLKSLNIKYLNDTNSRLLNPIILKRYHLPVNTKIPVSGTIGNEGNIDYFNRGILFIIYYHNPNSFDMLSKYYDEAVTKGYLRPRDYVNFKVVNGHCTLVDEMHLRNFDKVIKNTDEINRLRAKYLLPKYEVDHNKYLTEEKYNLKLIFWEW